MTTKAHRAQKIILSFEPHHTGLWLQKSFNEAHVEVLNKEKRKLFTWGSWKGKERKKKESYSHGGVGKSEKRKKKKEECGWKEKKRKEKEKKEKRRRNVEAQSRRLNWWSR